MKFLISIIALLAFQSAGASQFPAVYCVSTQSFENVNQINLFTNKSGTMRINLQYYAVSEDGADAGNFDTDTIQTVTRLQYDAKTGVITNGTGKLSLTLSADPITPKQAEKLMEKSKAGFDLENPSGSKIDFKKYYVAKMTEYNLPGKKDTWARSLMDAFKAGVTEYVCGKREDVVGRKRSIFDGD